MILATIESGGDGFSKPRASGDDPIAWGVAVANGG